MTLFDFRQSVPVPDSDDNLLAAVAAKGSVAAFETLVERYSQRVFALVVRITGSAPDAEEITQDVMMRVYSRAVAFDGRSAVSTWIFRIAYNAAIDHTRREERRLDRLPSQTEVSDDPVISCRADDNDTDPRIDLLEAALRKLEAPDRALITLYYYDEHTIAEIAEITHMSQSNVKVRLMRLRDRLRRFMTDN